MVVTEGKRLIAQGAPAERQEKGHETLSCLRERFPG